MTAINKIQRILLLFATIVAVVSVQAETMKVLSTSNGSVTAKVNDVEVSNSATSNDASVSGVSASLIQ